MARDDVLKTARLRAAKRRRLRGDVGPGMRWTRAGGIHTSGTHDGMCYSLSTVWVEKGEYTVRAVDTFILYLAVVIEFAACYEARFWLHKYNILIAP